MSGALAAILSLVGVSCAQWSADDSGEAEVRKALRQLDWRLPVAVTVSAGPACDTVVVGSADASCRHSSDSHRDVFRKPLVRAAMWARQTRHPDGRHILAVVDLWSGRGDSAARHRALNSLTDLAASAPDAIPVLVDLSAAHLLEYQHSGTARNLMDALEVAAKACRLDPRSTGAAWNRALALSWLGLRGTAVDAWREYSRVSGRPQPILTPGRDMMSLSAHDAALDGTWSDAVDAYIRRDVLPRWGSAVLAGDSVAAFGALSALDTIASRAQSNDSTDGPAATLEALRRPRSPVSRRDLAAGFLAADSVRAAGIRSDWGAWRHALSIMQTSPGFSTEFGRWVRFDSARLQLRTGGLADARRNFNALRSVSSGVITRRATLELALTNMVEGQQAAVVDLLQPLIERCLRERADQCATYASATLAGAQSRLGDDDAALETLTRAAASSSVMPHSTYRWTVLDFLRETAERIGYVDAVEDIVSETARAAARTGRTDIALITAALRAERALARSDLLVARALIRDFERLLTTKASLSERKEFEWRVLWERGELLRLSGDATASAVLDSAVSLAETSNNRARSFQIRLSSARSRLQAGDTAVAMTQLDSLLAESRLRTRDGSSALEHSRITESLSDAARDAARVLLAQGRAAQALDALSGRHFSSPRLVVPSAANIARLAVRQLGDSVLVWIVRGGQLHALVAPVSTTELARLVTSTDSAALTRLYETLLGTLGPAQSATQLRIDARGISASVPWSALRDPQTGRYLVETHEIALVPDITVVGEHSAAVMGNERILLVEAARMTGPNALPGAQTEIATLQEIWGPTARHLRTMRDTQPLSRAFTDATIVHFAGHAVLNGSAPERSGLLVASARGDSLIPASMLSRWKLTRTRLVILAACDTRATRPSTLGGLESLAGVLRDAGAREVIGTTWRVDDRATARMMGDLHRRLRAGEATGSALRAAQVTMLRSGDRSLAAPRAWAAFQLLGS